MTDEEILSLHARHHGVLNMAPQMAVHNREELGKDYTPGVAVISKLIERYPELKDKYTLSGKLVTMVTDGSAVLGLGNIGPAGGLPIVEGKALLYKDLAGVDAIPLTLDQVPVADFVQTLKNISKSFAGFHLEDIEAPRCFEIEEQLRQAVDIPVYHDDQEGTAIVVLAGLINAAKVVQKPLTDLKVVLNGLGASGVATARLLIKMGIKQLTLFDIDGQVHPDSPEYDQYQREVAQESLVQEHFDNLSSAMVGQDVFIGLSTADVLTATDVRTMAKDPIIFALANPKPEIDPAVVKDGGATIIATGSSQYPNQVNNILAFPGLYKGLLQTDLKQVTWELEVQIAQALAQMISQPEPTKIIPGVFDDGVVATVAQSVIDFAKDQHRKGD
ncbi:NADP-dependent malic enzyme [uncultured Limosilactobacillus sp.]|uniref:NAD(P)-dependent malic enzyme n=1 Tax=uncultured Limosilactobacillus sp. TaxID=2837629 RepID=UPI0025D6ED07|nr:malic enzyme-like NAD(P)-binding protein [uncultured Limosilactobacillus sp.]